MPDAREEYIIAVLRLAYSEHTLRNVEEAKRLVNVAFDLLKNLPGDNWRARAAANYYGGLVFSSPRLEEDSEVSTKMLREAVDNSYTEPPEEPPFSVGLHRQSGPRLSQTFDECGGNQLVTTAGGINS